EFRTAGQPLEGGGRSDGRLRTDQGCLPTGGGQLPTGGNWLPTSSTRCHQPLPQQTWALPARNNSSSPSVIALVIPTIRKICHKPHQDKTAHSKPKQAPSPTQGGKSTQIFQQA